MLSIHKLKKQYGSHLILDVDLLQFDSGLYWVKGANGSGKSTLLKILGGIIPFQGEIEIGSTSLKKQTTEYRRLVSYVEAEPLYPPFLTGSDLISFYSTTRNASKEQVKELTEKFNIQYFVQNPIGTYSSGMVKKLSLVLAFLGNPKYILLDEPLVTIDKDSVPILLALVRNYSNEGMNFIFTSHQAFEATGLAPIQELEVKNARVCFL